MTTDPVCGMSVDEKQAPENSEYQGKTLYFCSATCKEQFDQNPQTYLKQQAAKQ